MAAIIRSLWEDEAGFLVASELVLVSTILVLGMVVGLSEVSRAINYELADVASTFGSINQSYRYDGLFGHRKGHSSGSRFHDSSGYCDGVDIVASRHSSESH